MKIQFLRDIEKYLKSRICKIFIDNYDFTIISNNCWGTFIYKKFGLTYQSPFINAMIFAPDYIKLLEDFNNTKLENLTFIEHNKSKFIDEMKRLNIYQQGYPLGLIDGKYEINFLHYTTEDEAKNKWLNRCKRINTDKLIFKFSDGDLFEEEMAYRFEKLPFKNKVLFTSKSFDTLSSNIWIKQFENHGRVHDEWKHFGKYFNIYKLINSL